MSLYTPCSPFSYEGTNRLILGGGAVNPRDEVGKVGIRLHEGISRIFYDTITVQTPCSEGEKTFYLNRKSAVRWINAQEPQGDHLPLSAGNEEVIDRITQICSRSLVFRKGSSVGRQARRLDRVIDLMRGVFWNLFWKITIFSWHTFRLRFALFKKESFLQDGSEARANAIFWKGVAEVPAYRAHVGETVPKTFEEVPITDKISYIKPHIEGGTIAQTMRGGVLPPVGQCDTSTGTTGRPTMWIRGTEERRTTQTLLAYAQRVVNGSQPIFFINAFALGPWATGMTASNAFFEQAMTFSTGPDVEKILDVLAQFPPCGRKYVIAGYPPFMKDLVDAARRRGFDLNPYEITAVVGGEPIGDGTRRAILRNPEDPSSQGLAEVLSSYGASDLDINIGYESFFEQNLRRLCKEHPLFAAELYGEKEPVPSIFHYDPLNYYIEANEEKELVFTCVRQDRVSPRIRYNLHDRGQVMRVSDVMAIAKKHGVHLETPRTNLPLVFVWGREGTVNYRGAKVPIGHLQDAADAVFGANRWENVAFFEEETESGIRIGFMVELAEREEAPHIEGARQALIGKLCELNGDFQFQVQRAEESDSLRLEIYPHNQSPMSHADPHRKKQYVFRRIIPSAGPQEFEPASPVILMHPGGSALEPHGVSHGGATRSAILEPCE